MPFGMFPPHIPSEPSAVAQTHSFPGSEFMGSGRDSWSKIPMQEKVVYSREKINLHSHLLLL